MKKLWMMITALLILLVGCGKAENVEEPTAWSNHVGINNPENTNTIIIAVNLGTRLFLIYL